MTPAQAAAQIRRRNAARLRAGVEAERRKRKGQRPLRAQQQLVEELEREARELEK